VQGVTNAETEPTPPTPSGIAGDDAPTAGSDAERAAALEAELATERHLNAWLEREVWLAEARLTRSAIERERIQLRLDAIARSTSWLVTTPLRAVGRRIPRTARLLRRAAKVVAWTVTFQLPSKLRERRRGRAAAAALEWRRRNETYENWVAEYDTLTTADIEAIDELVKELDYQPLVSVLLPVCNTPARYLRQAIDSVLAQRYGNWELCIADDASTAKHVRKVLESYAARNPRIRVTYRAENGGISAASNSALELARGELTALLDHDDILRPHSLLLAVSEFARGDHIAWVYSDEDKIDKNGRRSGPYFKPDWNPELLLAQNYLCHLSVIRTALVREVGGFRTAFDGSQDWDLALRVTERVSPDAVAHVPHVLYHWRTIPGSTAAGPEAKPYAIEAARRATVEHLRRVGSPGYVLPRHTHQRIRYLVPRHPLVSVIIPSTGERDLLEPCVTGLLALTDYEELEVLVVVDEDETGERRHDEFLGRLEEAEERIRVVPGPAGPFNFSRSVNYAAARADGELLLLLNDDVEVVDPEWLEIAVGYVLQNRVGAVGMRLHYPDGTIQHAGMLVGAGGIAEILYRGRLPTIAGYLNRAQLPQDLSVVAGACMLVRRDAFEEVGGLDEAFPVAYNDVDFCLKLRDRGWRVLYVPDAQLVHHESASFGSYQERRAEDHDRDAERMVARWGAALDDDPMHNPNLALDATDPSRLAFPPRVSYPWRGRDSAGQESANRELASSASSAPEYS
jgi:GT2 family glycosyltransferase